MSDITHQLRQVCGHDSRSVDGCLNCEAADTIESLRSNATNAAPLSHHTATPPTPAVLDAAPVSLEALIDRLIGTAYGDGLAQRSAWSQMLMTERNHVIDTLRATPQEAAPVTGGKGCDCGCNDPCFTEPMEALQFLSDRMKHAGISEAVGLFYARDIDAILARYPTPADESGQGREAPRAVRLAYDALLEEQAAYEEPLFHVDAAVAALEKEYPGIAPETAGRGDSTLREDAARGRAIGAEYDALIRHMDGGGDFYEFQRDAARRARGDSNG